MIFGKSLTVSCMVDGAMQMKGDLLTINSSAKVAGPIRYEGNKEPEVSPQAKLASPVDYRKLEHKPRYMEGHYYVWQVIWLGAFVLFGLVLFHFIPTFTPSPVATADRSVASSCF